VSLLEHPYLLSAYCEPVNWEIEGSMSDIADTFGGDQGITLMIKNGARYFGSILVQLT